MDHNQVLLCRLMLSTSDIDRMCGLAREAGALGAKLTGAGGGGSVVALVSSAASAESVLSAWKAAGYRAFATAVVAEARSRACETEAVP